MECIISGEVLYKTIGDAGEYVHCVMHKCIMVKLCGKRKTHKVCKKHVNFTKSEGKCVKLGGNNKFREIGWEYTEIAKIRRKFVVDE